MAKYYKSKKQQNQTAGEMVKAIIEEMKKHYTLIGSKGQGIGMSDAVDHTSAVVVGENWKNLLDCEYTIDDAANKIYLIKN